MERVIVTGSAIPTAEEVGPNPVFSINRDLINMSAAGTTTEQLLQMQPVMNGAINVITASAGTNLKRCALVAQRVLLAELTFRFFIN